VAGKRDVKKRRRGTGDWEQGRKEVFKSNDQEETTEKITVTLHVVNHWEWANKRVGMEKQRKS